MGWWVPCISAVVEPLVFPEILVIVFIFFLVPVSVLRKCHYLWCGLDHHCIIGLIVQEMSLIYRFLDILLPPVVKSFWRLIFSLLCCLTLDLRKTYDKYICLESSLTSSSSSVDISLYLMLDFWVTYLSRTLCCLVITIADLISTLVLNLSYHWSLVSFCWWKLYNTTSCSYTMANR